MLNESKYEETDSGFMCDDRDLMIM